MKNLATAVIAVMKAVKGVEKNLTVGSGNSSYKGVADQDVKQIIGDAMTKNGLCILPTGTESKSQIDRWEEVDPYSKTGAMKTKQSVFTEVTTKYLLLHESGESVELMGYGHGIDTQDKGAGKATTYALKYALLYTFLVPTGKIDDADATHSQEIETPKAKTPLQPVKQAIKDKPVADACERIKAGELELYKKIINTYSLTSAQLEKMNDVFAEASLREPVPA